MALRRRQDAKTYFIDLWFLDESGKKKRYRRSTGRGVTRKEAEKLETQLKAELTAKGRMILSDAAIVLRAGKPVQETPAGKSASPFSGFAAHWFANHVRVRNKASEQHNKEMILKEHLGPFFGHTPLNEITAEDISRYIAQKLGASRGQKSVNNHLAVLSKLFNSAVEWGYLDRSPMVGIKKLKAVQREIDFYTAEETRAFVDACEQGEPFWYPFFLVAFATGMRLGELCALRWKDIDFDRNVIAVRASVWQGIEGTPKSGKGRLIPLHPRVRDVLAPVRRAKDELVFHAKGGTPLTRNSMRDPMERACKKAGLRCLRFHDIRHSFAS
jgi:integrase